MIDADRSPPDILVVDDTPANLQLLSDMLKAHGYKVRPVPNGRLALRAAELRPPDLILLDINMPQMDGYEVCRLLKQNPALKDIPVIFISAFNQTANIVRAFEAGGVDYVTKPFQFEEIRARIDTHCQIRALQHQLEARNQELSARYTELRELERLRDNLVHMIVHDMRSPLMGIGAYLELLIEDLADQLNAEHLGDLESAYQNSQALGRMVTDLLDVSRLETQQLPLQLAPHALAALAQQAVEALGPILSSFDLRIELPAELPEVRCDSGLIARVFANLLSNAARFAPPQSAISIDAQADPAAGLIRVCLRDEGPGVPEQQQSRIFEKFQQLQERRSSGRPSSGLGLTFCKLAVEAHGGRIGVISDGQRGSTFWFDLPIAGSAS